MRSRHVMLAMVVALAAAPALTVAGTEEDLHAQLRAQMEAKRAALFTQADGNGDGALSPAEFAKFEELVRNAMQERHFAKADTNQDGKVTLEELAAEPHRFRHGPCGGRF